ncbi:MAG: VanZ family protein [Planctomycetes bacterium]|nr:VanZ family protein [Planctomycetota bacterium]
MDSNSSNQPISQFLVRHHAQVLAALACLFVLQAGLIPFDFAPRQGDPGSRAFYDTSVHDLILPDIVSNIFLYVPLGGLLFWAFHRRIRYAVAAGLCAIGTAGLLSAGIEYAQAYIVIRVSSLIDLISNVIGATLGALIAWVCRLLIPRITAAAGREFRQRPYAVVLKAYGAILILFAAAPFTFSFDVARLKKSVRSVNLVPFAAREPNLGNWFETPAPETKPDQRRVGADDSGSSRSDAYGKWHRAKRWSRWGAECVSFLVLAALLTRVLRDDYGFSRRATTALVWWLCGLFALGLGLMQLPILSRACDITDVLFRLLGVGFSMLIWRRTQPWTHPARSAQARSAAPPFQFSRRTLRWGCMAALAYIVYTGVIPCLFQWDVKTGAASLASPAVFPFYAYFIGRFDLMMGDAMEKFSSYAVLAVLLAGGWTRAANLPLKRRIASVAMVCVPLSLAIEFLQLFIPIRVAGLTEPILASCACVFGVVLQEQAALFCHYAGSHSPAEQMHMVVPARTPTLAAPPVLSPTDQLIATLTEPHADAPTELPLTPNPTPERDPR